MGELGGKVGKEITAKFAQKASDQTQLIIRTAVGAASGGASSTVTAVSMKIIENLEKKLDKTISK